MANQGLPKPAAIGGQKPESSKLYRNSLGYVRCRSCLYHVARNRVSSGPGLRWFLRGPGGIDPRSYRRERRHGHGRARVCKAPGWVGVGVKPVRSCCGIRGLLCCGAPPQGLCKAPHDSGICWKQFTVCLGDTWFVAAFHSTPMHDPGPEEFKGPVRTCACKATLPAF